MERFVFHDSDFGLGVVDSVGVSCELEVFWNVWRNWGYLAPMKIW